MHPDQQIEKDFVATMATIFAIMLIVALTYTFKGSTFSDADACANRVRSAISPYQVKQLIGSEQLPPSYAEVKAWCQVELTGYELKIDLAKTFPEFPRTPDMLY